MLFSSVGSIIFYILKLEYLPKAQQLHIDLKLSEEVLELFLFQKLFHIYTTKGTS